MNTDSTPVQCCIKHGPAKETLSFHYTCDQLLFIKLQFFSYHFYTLKYIFAYHSHFELFSFLKIYTIFG